jgi:hypothetical protein
VYARAFALLLAAAAGASGPFAPSVARGQASPPPAPPLPAPPLSMPPMVSISGAVAAHAQELIAGLDLDEARRVLSAADADDPAIVLERARLALYEEDCDGAAAFLSRSEVARTEEGAVLADVARGCARVTAATVVTRDDDEGVMLRWQDEHDAPLLPLIVQTVVKARDALAKDLGVHWPRPTRITVVRDLLALSAMTGLPYEAARTTGTVAVAKWGRVTLLSPRASTHGFAWQDTLAHELSHLAVTRVTQDRAPLWLQEGVAKREEIRWRDPGPFDDRPSPDAMARRGIELKLDLPLDRLGPSIAMLPSADAAMVAFAEVTSFVRYFADKSGIDALPLLLLALRSGHTPDEALVAVSGVDLHAWDTRWRAMLAERPDAGVSSLLGLGSAPPDARELRERARLGELLLARGHARAAVTELDQLKSTVSQEDPSLRALRSRALLLAERAEAEAALGTAREVATSYPPWWTLVAHFADVHGDVSASRAAMREALAQDPLDVEAACGILRTPPHVAPDTRTGARTVAPDASLAPATVVASAGGVPAPGAAVTAVPGGAAAGAAQGEPAPGSSLPVPPAPTPLCAAAQAWAAGTERD